MPCSAEAKGVGGALSLQYAPSSRLDLNKNLLGLFYTYLVVMTLEQPNNKAPFESSTTRSSIFLLLINRSQFRIFELENRNTI